MPGNIMSCHDDDETASEAEDESGPGTAARSGTPQDLGPMPSTAAGDVPAEPVALPQAPEKTVHRVTVRLQPGVCKVCSLDSGTDALTCAACGHVLDPSTMRDCWTCKSSTCKELGYVNVGDNGLCGLCGECKA